VTGKKTGQEDREARGNWNAKKEMGPEVRTVNRLCVVVRRPAGREAREARDVL